MSNPSSTVQAFEPLTPGMDSDPMTQIERIFVYFLQNLFRTFPEGCGMRWQPNEESTEVLISSSKPELTAIEKVPHIVCIPGASRWGNVGMDQLQHLQFMTGRRKHTDLISSTMAYHCQAREGIVARRLAWNTSFYTNVFRRILQKINGIHQVGPGQDISPESGPTAFTGPKVETDIVSVVVTVPFFWQVQWIIQNEAVHVWRRLKLLLNVDEGLSGGTSQIEPPEIAFTQSVREDSYPT